MELGIRPENLHIVTERDGQTFECRVKVREPIGSDNYLHVGIQDTECTVRIPGDQKPEPNDRLVLRFDEKDLHLFDTETGETLRPAANKQLEGQAP